MSMSVTDDQDMRTITLSLPDMHCAGCLRSVEKVLKEMPGVAVARVNLTQKRAVVEAGAIAPDATLIAALKTAGFAAHSLPEDAEPSGDRTGQRLLRAMAVAGFAMVNVMLLSVSVWSGADPTTRDMFHWISAGIAIPALIYAARPFAQSAWHALRVWRLNMDVPITVAIVLAALMSLVETMLSGQDAYFDAALSLTFFLLLGRYLDHRTRGIARSAADQLTALESRTAIMKSDDAWIEVPVESIRPGDIIALRPGMRAAVDGVVVSGEGDLDLSALTGESVPAGARVGTPVAAGSISLNSALTLRVTAVGEETALRRLAGLVRVAENWKGRYASLADRAAAIYAPGVHGLALVAFVGWAVATGDIRLSLNIAVAVLIITCPCALGLASPAVATRAIGLLFARGVAVMDGEALERLAEVDHVVLDKTGTVTTGLPMLDAAVPDEALRLAAGLAQHSDHPYSRAILAAALSSGIAPPKPIDWREVPGSGLSGDIDGVRICLGKAGFVGIGANSSPGLWLREGDAAPILLPFVESFRTGARSMVRELDELGLHVSMLSGDGAGAVQTAQTALGVEDAVSEADPVMKLEKLKDLSEHGDRVLMIGDGINDTGALAAASVSAAPGHALDAARVAADIVLLAEDLRVVPAAIRIARSARRRIVENFAIAAGYNAVAIPIALAGYASPLLAALAMSASSICVSLNALRVR